MNNFGKMVDGLANAITGQIKTAWSGENTVGSALGASRNTRASKRIHC
ncbi:hypothetical protein [Pectobacterium brasiliense]|nr:hypothetical protein [Pectobacterium brasiliense]